MTMNQINHSLFAEAVFSHSRPVSIYLPQKLTDILGQLELFKSPHPLYAAHDKQSFIMLRIQDHLIWLP